MEKINGRTPEEIKRAIKCNGLVGEYEDGHCDGKECAYAQGPDDTFFLCGKVIACRDAYAYIERLEDARQKWISVKDQPPVYPCLYWDGQNQVNVSRSIGTLTLSDGTIAYLADVDVLDMYLAVTNGMPPDDCTKILYWMPLPEPPEEAVHDD